MKTERVEFDISKIKKYHAIFKDQLVRLNDVFNKLNAGEALEEDESATIQIFIGMLGMFRDGVKFTDYWLEYMIWAKNFDGFEDEESYALSILQFNTTHAEAVAVIGIKENLEKALNVLKKAKLIS